jgi:hypothetical protein
VFEKLKRSFTSATVLYHFDPQRKFVIETNASNLVVTGVLSQQDNEDILYPIAYISKKHSPAEINHKIYDKRLLAIICTFKE